MKGIDLYDIVAFASPACSASLMLIMLGWDIMTANKHNKRPHHWLFLFFVTMTVRELSPVMYHYAPEIFVYFNWLYCLTLFLTPVLYYRFLFEITRVRADEHFPWQHYISPIAISLPVLVLTFVLPYNELYQVIDYCNYPFIDGTLGIASYVNLPAKFVITLFYFILCIVRIRDYSKFAANHTPGKNRAGLRWVYWYPLSVLFLTAMLLVIMFVPRSTDYLSPLIISLLFILAFLQLNIVYHTLRRDYIIVESPVVAPSEDMPPIAPPEDTPPEATADQSALQNQKKDLLTKEFFEEYIRTRKPYLNPNLKITDLVDDLEMNRTYISGFINREYKMNFSRYINHCRLDEYNRLLADPAMQDISKEDLAELAGFSSYRYFLRLKNEN